MPVRVKAAKLVFDSTWQRVRCKECTGLADTSENRRRCGHTMCLVDAAIRRGDFDYRAFFPRGSRLHLFSSDARPDGLMSFQEYILRWHRLRSPFGTDGTGTIRRHLVPAFGPLSL